MFFVGAQGPHWLDRATVPLMLSRSRLDERKRALPRAAVPWFLDSAAFTELERHGGWTIEARTWAASAQRFADEAGSLVAVSTLDWLCTPHVLTRTGLSVAEHQHRTCTSLLVLRELAPQLPWVPTLQGWTVDDYRRHVELYDRHGVKLDDEPLVGLGSVALRQHTSAARSIIEGVRREGVERLHAFGAKRSGLAAWGSALRSADSMSWSYAARRGNGHCGGAHVDCRNCQPFAEQWARHAARLVGSGDEQLALL